jgi:hypothetical protein
MPQTLHDAVHKALIVEEEDLCSQHRDDILLSRGLLIEDHRNNNNFIRNNTILGPFNIIDRDHRLLGQQLLLWGLGALDQILDVGHVERHITNEIV